MVQVHHTEQNLSLLEVAGEKNRVKAASFIYTRMMPCTLQIPHRRGQPPPSQAREKNIQPRGKRLIFIP